MKLNQLILGGFGLILPLTLGLAGGCKTRFDECTPGFNCEGDGDGVKSGGSSPGGDGSGGESNSGGSKAGGASNVGGNVHSGGAHTGGVVTSGGMGGEAAGGAPPKPCDGKCKGDTPFCDEGDKDVPKDDKCVGCLKHTDCKDPTMPMCSLEQVCVPCFDDNSCTDTLGLTDAPVCLNGAEDGVTDEVRPDTGECVECGTSSDCDGDICDLEAEGGPKCLDGVKYRKQDVCQTCTHDLECKDGQLCVEQKFDGAAVGKFCTWTKEALVGASGSCLSDVKGPPFVKTETTLTSVGGETVSLCVLARTTCAGYLDHLQPKTSCIDSSAESDAECGVADVDDGLCRQVPNDTSFRCTYPCGTREDCKVRGTQYECVGTTPSYCELATQ